jgi:hypothetical protein
MANHIKDLDGYLYCLPAGLGRIAQGRARAKARMLSDSACGQLNLLNVDAAVLYRLDGTGDLKEPARGGV